MPPVAVLIATRDRELRLRDRALPSVARQTLRPAAVVVVNDGSPMGEPTLRHIREASTPATPVILPNERVRGAAGAWNTGLACLHARGHSGFVAILDDDDEWDPDHLEVNSSAASTSDADLSVSGLRLVVEGVPRPRPLIRELRAADFLTGNPGWQGSNTFATLALLLAVGGFRDGLVSLNDRDLALRVLRHGGVRTVLIPRWTATWHLSLSEGLSAPGTTSKLTGLAAFWRLYGAAMSERESELFFSRAEALFNFNRDTIVAHNAPSIRHCEPRGDLRV